MAAPFLYNKQVEINGAKYFDGSFSDPLPINIPEIKDSRKIVLLTSSPNDHAALNLCMEKFLACIFRWKLNKNIRKSMESRYRIYQQTLSKLGRLEKKGDIIIRPSHRMSRFDNSPKTIFKNIRKGYNDAVFNKKIIELINDLKNSNSHYFS